VEALPQGGQLKTARGGVQRDGGIADSAGKGEITVHARLAPAPSSWQKSLKAMLPESVFATLSVVIDPESVPPQLPAIGVNGCRFAG